MHASQRGSVLLTVIAGILILAIVGAAALALYYLFPRFWKRLRKNK